MKIYGLPTSSCTLKVLMVLGEKGREAELIPVDLGKGAHKEAAHLKLHPFGVIPVLDDDGFLLYESRAIARYLDQKLPGTALVPADVKAKARMEQWISVEQSYLTPPMLTLVHQRFLGPMQGKSPDEAVVARALEDADKALRVADQALAAQEYFAGGTFSLADVFWMPCIQHLYLAQAGDLVANNRHVATWWKNVTSRKAWLQVSAPRSN
jgi:glutathione S-transferase